MNKENASKLWKIIQEAGDYLRDQQYTIADASWHYFTLVTIRTPSQKEITVVGVKYGHRKTRT